jgi:hypothetical protein
MTALPASYDTWRTLPPEGPPLSGHVDVEIEIDAIGLCMLAECAVDIADGVCTIRTARLPGGEVKRATLVQMFGEAAVRAAESSLDPEDLLGELP